MEKQQKKAGSSFGGTPSFPKVEIPKIDIPKY